MIDVEKYIVNGVVEREKIAMDIKYRVISRADIEYLVKNPIIKGAFWGNGYSDKRPQSSWTREYVDKLSYAIVSEAFNEDYLLYLNDVSEYVAKKKGNRGKIIETFIKKKLMALGLIGLVVVGIVAFVIFKMIR